MMHGPRSKEKSPHPVFPARSSSVLIRDLLDDALRQRQGKLRMEKKGASSVSPPRREQQPRDAARQPIACPRRRPNMLSTSATTRSDLPLPPPRTKSPRRRRATGRTEGRAGAQNPPARGPAAPPPAAVPARPVPFAGRNRDPLSVAEKPAEHERRRAAARRRKARWSQRHAGLLLLLAATTNARSRTSRRRARCPLAPSTSTSTRIATARRPRDELRRCGAR